MDGTQMLNLLYAALLALENPALDNRAVRYAYEVRLMVQGGEFPQDVVKDESLSKGARYAFWYMISAPLQRLFAFRVSDEVLGEIEKKQDNIRGKLIDRTFRSLEILDSVTNIH
jgi:DNA repair protein RecO (recombination protein O)